MSTPAYVIFPIEGNGVQNHEQKKAQGAKIASAIQRSIDEEIDPERHQASEHEEHTEQNGPLKAMLDQDSLYKYISWEDPTRTLGSYLGILSILIVAHYLPFTQLALKAGSITLGSASIIEFTSRAFGPDTFLARLRPKPYKKIPENILNATLKDIHDLVQYSVSQAQKIAFAQDLDKTFFTSLGLGAAFWLNKALSTFNFYVLALTSIYIVSLALSRSPSERSRIREMSRRAIGPEKAPAHGPAHPVNPKEDDEAHDDKKVSDTELRTNNLGYRSAGSNGSVEPSIPSKAFNSSIPVATTFNDTETPHGSNW